MYRRTWGLDFALPAAGVQVYCPARVEAMEQDADGVVLRLDDAIRATWPEIELR